MGAALVADHAVDRELGVAVRVDGGGGDVLGHRDLLGLPVDGAGGGEHEPADAGLAHRVEQVERADVVAAVVALRVRDGLGHQRQRGEVQDAVEAVGEGVARRPPR